MTGARVRRIRLLEAVAETFELAEKRKLAAILSRQRADRGDVVRADAHAFGLAFAAVAIDDRCEHTRFRLAVVEVVHEFDPSRSASSSAPVSGNAPYNMRMKKN